MKPDKNSSTGSFFAHAFFTDKKLIFKFTKHSCMKLQNKSKINKRNFQAKKVYMLNLVKLTLIHACFLCSNYENKFIRILYLPTTLTVLNE